VPVSSQGLHHAAVRCLAQRVHCALGVTDCFPRRHLLREAFSLTEDTIRVYFLTPDPGLAEAIAKALSDGFVTQSSDDFQPGSLNDLRKWDVVLIDLRSRGAQSDDGASLRLLDEIVRIHSHPPIVALCDAENQALVFGALEHGAYDSVTSPPNIIELRLVLRRAYKSDVSEKELQRLRESVQGPKRLHELYGSSPVMQELFGLAQKIAPCDVNVLITGETGTGKELLARAIHHLSLRFNRALVAFSCVNLPETLIEDELFGHEKGAFTGALNLRRGRLEAADQGTLFLDEIGDLSLGLQPKLLRVLQERNFERLGSNASVNVNIRLICATNRNLGEMVQQGTFREDLYYRLNVVQLHLPPLRERRDDIPLLAQLLLAAAARRFNKKARHFSRAALHVLEEYGWPGNVRELENSVQRAVVLSEGQTINLCHLPAAVRGNSEKPILNRSYEEEVRQFKRRLLLRTLGECGWQKAASARALGVARGYLHRLINQLEIREPEGENLAEGVCQQVPPNELM
jgi:DNA-binding NtrC family response regulator